MFLLFLSFVAGVLTVLAPCILPLLPVIVGGSVAEGNSKWRAPVVILSLGVSIFLFTLLLKVSASLAHIPAAVWTGISGVLIVFFGLLTLFPHLWDVLPGMSALNRSSNKLMGTGYLKKNFAGDILIGAALGPVFSSCSPTYFLILATVLPVNFSVGLLYLAVYTLGLCLSLFLISILGQRLVSALGIASDPNGKFKKILGVIFILVGVAILFGVDKNIEAGLLANAGVFDVTKIEQTLLENNAVKNASTTVTAADLKKGGEMLAEAQKAARYKKAPELVRPDAYLNTAGAPISLAQYRGKNVVLIDFWTYSCINCQRTLPYLTSWYGKYKDQGLVIIGVHTPEFAFEHVEANVADALKRFGITHPVILDNEYGTWNAFGNQLWPREYLIDIDGYIVHDHAGEGEYDATEKAIQDALAERAERLSVTADIPKDVTVVTPVDFTGIRSPETYFGAARNEYLGNGNKSVVGTQKMVLPKVPEANTLYLGGTWDISKEYATGSAGSEVLYTYKSKEVYLVASTDSPADIEVIQDGAPLGSSAGGDVSGGVIRIGQSRLYKVVANPDSDVHTLRIKVKNGTVHFYTFTFG